MTFGSYIRQLRKSHRYTLRELADLVGIDFTYLSKIENDRAPAPAEERIRMLAKLLGADAEELILLANKLPTALERDLLERPEQQVAELYRSMVGKRYTNEEWQLVLELLKEKGSSL